LFSDNSNLYIWTTLSALIDHSTLYRPALKAASMAALKIMEIYEGEFDPEFKTDGSPVTAADLASSDIINKILAETNIPVTSEETIHEDYSVRKKWNRSWCVDPLDGTKEFVKRNGEFSINIALIENQRPIFGLIASPVSDEVVFGGGQMGIYFCLLSEWQNIESWKKISTPEKVNEPLVVASSRSHHSGQVLQYVNELRSKSPEIHFLKMGSALKFFSLADGSADTYPRFAPTMEWDIAAGQAILEALGGKVVHAETGEPLIYNKDNLKNPYFIASTKAFLQWKG
jgi:3'(2'), 5'-bisphosphate nucleotidase